MILDKIVEDKKARLPEHKANISENEIIIVIKYMK